MTAFESLLHSLARHRYWCGRRTCTHSASLASKVVFPSRVPAARSSSRVNCLGGDTSLRPLNPLASVWWPAHRSRHSKRCRGDPRIRIQREPTDERGRDDRERDVPPSHNPFPLSPDDRPFLPLLPFLLTQDPFLPEALFSPALGALHVKGSPGGGSASRCMRCVVLGVGRGGRTC